MGKLKLIGRGSRGLASAEFQQPFGEICFRHGLGIIRLFPIHPLIVANTAIHREELCAIVIKCTIAVIQQSQIAYTPSDSRLTSRSPPT